MSEERERVDVSELRRAGWIGGKPNPRPVPQSTAVYRLAKCPDGVSVFWNLDTHKLTY